MTTKTKRQTIYTDKSYLWLRGGSYSVRLKVPNHLQTTVGKVNMVKALKTRDIAVANKRKGAYLSQWHEYFYMLSRDIDSHPRTAEGKLDSFLADLGSRLKAGDLSREAALEEMAIGLDDHLESLGKHYGRCKETGDIKLPYKDEQALHRKLEAICNPGKIRLSDALAKYLSDHHTANMRASSLKRKVTVINSFKEFTTDADITTLTAKDAMRYVREVLDTNGNAVSTNREAVSALSAFWNYLRVEGDLTTNNIWTGAKSKLSKGTTRGIKDDDSRREPTKDELGSILGATLETKANATVSALILIGLYSGLRSNEICELKIEDVHLDTETPYYSIVEGKNASSIRLVPIHPLVLPLVKSLAAKVDSKDYQWLLPGLKPCGVDGKRNPYLTSTMSRHIRSLVPDERVVFHSLRKAFTTKLHTNRTEITILKKIIGHTNSDISTGLYSQGFGIEELAKAVTQVTYGTTVDTLTYKAIQHLITQ